MSKVFTWLAILILFLGYGGFVYRQHRQALPCLVCLGDSLTECGGMGGRFSDFLAPELPSYRIVNRGVSGDTLAGGRSRFRRDVLNFLPRVVVIELDANDFHRHDRPPEDLRADLEFMVQSAQGQGVGVVLAGVFGSQRNAEGELVPKLYREGSPELGRQILEMERAVAKKFKVPHVENIQAGLNQPEDWASARHPSAAGNRKVAACLLPCIQKVLAEKKLPVR